CESYNPGWSWFAGDAVASAVIEFPSGARFVFNGSWCSPGQETSWNGRWRVSGERGTAVWDGDNPQRPAIRCERRRSATRPSTPQDHWPNSSVACELVRLRRQRQKPTCRPSRWSKRRSVPPASSAGSPSPKYWHPHRDATAGGPLDPRTHVRTFLIETNALC